MIGLDRIKALILQGIGAHLVGKADAATFLIEIEQNTRSLGPHLCQGRPQLGPAVAFQAAEHIAGETGGMQPRQDGCITVRAADFNGVVFGSAIIGAKDMHAASGTGRHRKPGRDYGRHGRKAVKICGVHLCQKGERVGSGKGHAIGHWHQHSGGQKLR